MPQSKNVLLITIDGLRFDRTGFGGHSPSPSPFMDELMHKGLSLSNAFSTSFPTQFAMPSLFTSTLPLDSGGYDAGIRDRDTSFVEVLKQNGYRTAGFFNGFWGSDLFYYDRGFDNFYTCVSPKLVAESFSNIYLPQLFRTYNATKSIEKCVAYFKPLLADFFTWFNVFCTQKEKEITSSSFVVSAVTHNWDFSGIQAIVQAEQKKFKKNPRTYIKKLLSQQGRSRFDEIAGHYRKRTDLEKKARSASAARMFESTARLMDHYISEDPSTPFFIWTHLMDVHDCIYSPHDVIYEASHDVMEDQEINKQEVQELKKLSRQIAATGEAYQGSPRYDLATRSCDMQLERLVSWMRSMGIMQDTLIVLTSDHGFRKAGYPPREDIDVGDFFDELHKVPLAFIAEDIKSGRLDMLHSSMDVGPSLLDYLGMDIPRSFKGGSVFDPGFSTTGHPELIFESMGRLLCDFDNKPVNVCVRDTRSKMTCSLQPGASPDKCQVVSYFDLQDDPYELQNLAGSREGFDSRIKTLAADRLARILADRDQAAASRPGKARASEFEARANIEPDNADFQRGRFQEPHLHRVEKPGQEPQVTWQTYLAGLPYARDLMQTWQYIMLDADYEQALNLYLSSTHDTLPLEKRYQDLLQSQALLLGGEKDQARHMSTSMLLVRIYSDLGERRQAASIAGELLKTLQDAGELHLHRPFVPPIKSFETQPVRRNYRSWLTASAMEAIARLQDDTGYHSCQKQIKYLNFACSLPEHSLEMERRLALCAMRSGQEVSIDPNSWLVSNDHLNKAIWEDMAGLGQQAVMEEQVQGHEAFQMDGESNVCVRDDRSKMTCSLQPSVSSDQCMEKPGHEPQVTWQTYLAKLPYARDLMQTWQYIMLDAEYEQALNLYLSSTNDTLPLEKRYQDLLQSQALLLGFEKDQARHMSTSMLLVRIYTDLGERRQAASIAGELLNTLQAAGEAHQHRPFIPPIKNFEPQPVHQNYKSWLTASTMEAVARLQYDTGYHSCQEQIKYLNFVCSLPEHSLEMKRRLALCAMRSGQEVSVDPQSWLVSNDHLNKAIWEDMAGLGQQAVSEDIMSSIEKIEHKISKQKDCIIYNKVGKIVQNALEAHKQEEWETALIYWKKAQQLRPDLTPEHFNRYALACEMNDDWDLHNEIVHKGLNKYPEDFDLTIRLMFNEAIQHFRSENWKQAILQFESLQKHKNNMQLPISINYLHKISTILYQLKRCNKSQKQQLLYDQFSVRKNHAKTFPQDLICLDQKFNTKTVNKKLVHILDDICRYAQKSDIMLDEFVPRKIKETFQHELLNIHYSDLKRLEIHPHGWKLLSFIATKLGYIKRGWMFKQLMINALEKIKYQANSEWHRNYAFLRDQILFSNENQDTEYFTFLYKKLKSLGYNEDFLELSRLYHGTFDNCAFHNISDTDKKFADFLKDKSIAIVGPIDVGLNNGQEIDSYDIVIRFTYTGSEDYKHYKFGSKTHISSYGLTPIINMINSGIIYKINNISHSIVHTSCIKIINDINNIKTNIVPRYDVYLYNRNPFLTGVGNSIQRTLMHILKISNNRIKIFNANLYLSDAYCDNYNLTNLKKYNKKYIKKTKSTNLATKRSGLSYHEPSSNFIFLQCLFQHGYFVADAVLEDILSMNVEDYITKIDHLYSVQE